jgi:hypothetical protein
MERSHTWEAASYSAAQEFPNILWNPKFYYRVHKSPPLDPILSQLIPVHTTQFYSSDLLLSYQLRLGVLLPSGFPTKILDVFSFSFMLATCPSYRILPDFTILIIQSEPKVSIHFRESINLFVCFCLIKKYVQHWRESGSCFHEIAWIKLSIGATRFWTNIQKTTSY